MKSLVIDENYVVACDSRIQARLEDRRASAVNPNEITALCRCQYGECGDAVRLANLEAQENDVEMPYESLLPNLGFLEGFEKLIEQGPQCGLDMETVFCLTHNVEEREKDWVEFTTRLDEYGKRVIRPIKFVTLRQVLDMAMPLMIATIKGDAREHVLRERACQFVALDKGDIVLALHGFNFSLDIGALEVPSKVVPLVDRKVMNVPAISCEKGTWLTSRLPEPKCCTFSGKVISGYLRGSADLGMATANIEYNSAKELAPVGVYEGWCRFISGAVEPMRDGSWRPMVMSVGYNPFYENDKASIEVHVLEDLGGQSFYGAEMEITPVRLTRIQVAFSGFSQLIRGLQFDCELARERLSLGTNEFGCKVVSS